MIEILHLGLSDNIGGIEIYLYSFARHLNQDAYRFSFLTYNQNKLAFEDELEKLGCRFYRLQHPRKRLFNYRHKKELFAFFKRHSFQAIEQHVVDLYDAQALRVAKSAHIDIRIMHAHAAGYYGQPSLFVRLNILVNKITLHRYATHCVGCSLEALDFTFGKRHGGMVIPNGIEADKYLFDERLRTSFRRQNGISDRTTVVCTVGRTHKSKNQSFLLRVFAKYVQLNPDSFLLIAGDGPELDSLKQLSSDLNISNRVRFLGKVHEPRPIYFASDAFVFPSISEGYGISVVEALVSGLPCLCSLGVPVENEEPTRLRKISLEKGVDEWCNQLSTMLRSLPSRKMGSAQVAPYSIYSTIRLMCGIYSSLETDHA